jgi:hypothetical protein
VIDASSLFAAVVLEVSGWAGVWRPRKRLDVPGACHRRRRQVAGPDPDQG